MRQMNIIMTVAAMALLMNCGGSPITEVTHATSLYAEPDFNAKVLAALPKGTAVNAKEYRNHKLASQRLFIKVEYKGTTGYIPAKSAVVGQNPENSVYLTGYKKDYEPFYSPKDKKYKGMYEYAPAASLPKEKIPLDELLKNTKLEK